MRRSPRVLLAWAAALIVVLVTVRVVTSDLSSIHRRARDLGADVTVVLAARDLLTGATVGTADVRTVRRPSTTISADAVRDPKLAVGHVVAVALLRDDVVSTRHLVTTANGIVPSGQRAVHVVVKDGFRPPVGAVVDVLATFDPALASVAGAPGQAAVVARGARLLALSDSPRADDTAATDTTGAGVTLLVSEAEARTVAYAASIGEVALALAPVETACCPTSGP